MKTFNALITMSLLLVSSVNAQELTPSSDGSAIQCRTESQGYAFEHRSTNTAQSQQAVYSACRATPGTDSTECAERLTCGQGNRPEPGSIDRLMLGMVGTWKASNCSNCYLQVYLYQNQLYGDMTPWEGNSSYSQGLQPISFLSEDTFNFRNDVYRLTLNTDQYGGPRDFRMDRLTDYGTNVVSATKNLFQNFPTFPNPNPYPNPNPNPNPNPIPYPVPYPPLPHPAPFPQNCPIGMIWDYHLDRCVPLQQPIPQPIPQPPRPGNCPPGTVWDFQIDRCVSVITPPRPQPFPPRPPIPAPIPQPPRPGNCPPGTVWDASLGRCVSFATPPRPVPMPQPPRPVPMPQPPRPVPMPQPPRPVPMPQPPRPVPAPQPPRPVPAPQPPRPVPAPQPPRPQPNPGGRCPPGTHLDPDLGRCVAG
jgi:hypothetical protein